MGVSRVRIQPGSILDLDAVMVVMDDSFDPQFGEAWTAPQCAGLMPMSGVWLTLARDEDEVVGFTLSRAILKESELLLLAVRRGCQKKGVGQLLLDSFITDSARRGAERLHLEVRDGNRAFNLYAKAGFSQVGRRRNYYSGPHGQVFDALTLARSIDL